MSPPIRASRDRRALGMMLDLALDELEDDRDTFTVIERDGKRRAIPTMLVRAWGVPVK